MTGILKGLRQSWGKVSSSEMLLRVVASGTFCGAPQVSSSLALTGLVGPFRQKIFSKTDQLSRKVNINLGRFGLVRFVRGPF